jgi:hypothetical protein
MSAGMKIREYASDPRAAGSGAEVLREQLMGCGPSPTSSAAFTQRTRFIELILGANVPGNHGLRDCEIHYELGNDPLRTLAEAWKAGTLPAPTIPIPTRTGAHGHILEVGPGARIALLGLNMAEDPLRKGRTKWQPTHADQPKPGESRAANDSVA